MSQDGLDRRLLIVLAVLFLSLLAWVFFLEMGTSGLLGPDEPRYASIGRRMAESGDWVTPVLNGRPWYEKPPLLYWLAGAGFKAGLGEDAAPRAFVAVLSLAALAMWGLALARIEGGAVALASMVILGSTAGWAALSMVAVTDLPLAASFAGTLGLGVLAVERGSVRAAAGAGLFLGLAMLAKGLVPLVLLAPFLLWARERWRLWAVVLGVAVGVALPWYAAMTVQHGRAFLEVFFVQHHFGRFSSETLQHVRPVWFYVPVLMAGLFPWTPLTGLFDGGLWRDPRNRVWLWTAAFGVVFFSLSTNKLPGYLLPLFPAISVLLARALQAAAAAGKTLAVCAFLLALAPAIASLLPDALLNGLSRARMSEVHWEYLAVAAPFGLAAYWLDRRGWRVAAVSMIGALTVGALVYVKLSTAPVLGEVVSARGLARRLHGKAGEACVEGLHRNYRYGLEYYLRRELPDCEAAPGRRYGIVQEPGRLPQVTPR